MDGDTEEIEVQNRDDISKLANKKSSLRNTEIAITKVDFSKIPLRKRSDSIT